MQPNLYRTVSWKSIDKHCFLLWFPVYRLFSVVVQCMGVDKLRYLSAGASGSRRSSQVCHPSSRPVSPTPGCSRSNTFTASSSPRRSLGNANSRRGMSLGGANTGPHGDISEDETTAETSLLQHPASAAGSTRRNKVAEINIFTSNSVRTLKRDTIKELRNNQYLFIITFLHFCLEKYIIQMPCTALIYWTDSLLLINVYRVFHCLIFEKKK